MEDQSGGRTAVPHMSEQPKGGSLTRISVVNDDEGER